MSIHVPSIPTLDRVVSVVSARHPVLLRIQCLPGSPGSENLHPEQSFLKLAYAPCSPSCFSAGGALIPTAQGASHQL